MSVERILIVFREDGSIKGIASYALNGAAEPMTAETAAALLPHAEMLAQVQALQAEVEAGAGDKARIAELEAHLAALTSAAPAAITYLSDLWRRASDAESEQIEALIQSLSARERNLLAASQYLAHDDADFPRIREALVGLFGESRASALLAPSA